MNDEPNHLEYVGIITSNWSRLELVINSTIHILADVTHEVGSCLTANLGSIHLKLRSLQGLVELRGGSPKLIKDIRSFQDSISATSEKRNRITHDPWMPVIGGPESKFGQLVSKADKKGREFGIKIVSIADLVEINREIMRRHDEFFKLREKIKAELSVYATKLS